ncbi:Myosin type-2 heavy chain 1, partial [Teratosphaeriaceae sp. CCFEE 6253]
GQVQNYESQLKSWRDRNTALESRANDLQREANQAGITAAKLTAVEQDFQRLQTSFEEGQLSMRRLQDEERALRDSLKTTSQELEVTRQSKTVSETEKLSLRQQLAEMQDQLELAKRQVPAPVNGELTNGNGATAAQASGLINLVASKKPKRRSAQLEQIDTERFSGTFNPRPVSMAFGATSGHAQNL